MHITQKSTIFVNHVYLASNSLPVEDAHRTLVDFQGWIGKISTWRVVHMTVVAPGYTPDMSVYESKVTRLTTVSASVGFLTEAGIAQRRLSVRKRKQWLR